MPRFRFTFVSKINAIDLRVVLTACLLTILMTFFVSAAEDLHTGMTTQQGGNILEVEEFVAKADELTQAPQYAGLMVMLRTKLQQMLPHIYQRSQRDPRFRLGALHPAEMFARFNYVRVFENRQRQLILGDPNRLSDFYLIGGFLGLFNTQDFLASSDRAQLGLLLHVFLGASGYQDDDYQLTLALLMAEQSFAMPDDRIFDNIRRERIFPRTQAELIRRPEPVQVTSQRPTTWQPTDPESPMILMNDVKAAGGYTGVGGGGDGSSLQMKWTLLELAPVHTGLMAVDAGFPCFDQWSDYTTFLKDVLDVKIESSATVSVSGGPQRLLKTGARIAFVIPKLHGVAPEEITHIGIQLAVRYCYAKYDVTSDVISDSTSLDSTSDESHRKPDTQ